MRNPNRLIGVSLGLVLLLAFASWRYEEYKLGKDKPLVVSQADGPGGPARTPSSTLRSSSVASKRASSIKPIGQADVGIPAFRSWVKEYQAAAPQDRAALEAAGADFAKLRAGEMARLLKSDPKAFFGASLSPEVRASLPPRVQEYVERTISGLGKVETEFTTHLDGHGTSRHFATINGERFAVSFLGAPVASTHAGSQPLHGVALGGSAVLSSDPVRVLSKAEAEWTSAQGKLPAEAKAPVTGQPVSNPAGWVDIGGSLFGVASLADVGRISDQIRQIYHPTPQLMDLEIGQTNLPPSSSVTTAKGRFKVMVARFRFPEDPSEVATENEIGNLMERSSSIIREWSYGTAELVLDYTPLLVLPQSRRWYAESFSDTITALKTDALRALTDAGYSVGPGSPHRFVQCFFPRIPNANRFPVAGITFPADGIAFQYEPNLNALLGSYGYLFGLNYANVADARAIWHPAGNPPPLPPAPPVVVWDIHALYGMDGFERLGLYEDLGASIAYDYPQTDPWEPVGGSNVNPSDFPDSSSLAAAEFNALHKYKLGWLPGTYARAITGSRTIRLYAFDTPVLNPTNIYMGVVRKDIQRTYYLEHRRQVLRNARLSRGILLHWDTWKGTSGSSQLIDTTPGTLDSFYDSPLVIGRTFADTVNGIYITPVKDGIDATGEWIDVTVNQGAFTSNRPPTFTMTASTVTAKANETITFSADSVIDPDGDAVSYHWDFGDGSFGDNQAQVAKTFAPGDYVVRLEVSDMKGGITSDHLVVNVGAFPTNRIHGSIVDLEGSPVPNVRVVAIGANNYVGFTDSQGRYSITMITNNTLTNLAYRFGYDTVPLNFENPSSVQGRADGEFNFLAMPLPKVSVSSLNDIDLSRVPSSSIRFTRSGDLSAELVAKYRLDGDALAGVNFEAPDLTDRVIFPPGVDQVDVKVTGKAERLGGGQKQLIVTVLMPTNQIRFSNSITNDGTNDTLLTITNSISVPGLYEDSFNNHPTPRIIRSETDPIYAIGWGEASMKINNPAAPPKPKVSMSVFQDYLAENGSDAALMILSIPQALTTPLSVRYTVSGTASNGVDILPLSGTVVIPAGRVAYPLDVVAVPDHLIEGNETVTITLEPGGDLYEADAAASAATIVVVDDDLPMVTVGAFRSEAYETFWTTNAGEAQVVDGAFRITRSGSVAEPLTVQYLLGGTAQNGLDFQALPGSVVIPAGQSFVDITVVATEDDLEEGDEFVTLQIAADPTYTAGVPGNARVVIYDGQLPVVEVFSPGANAGEVNGTASFQLLRAGPFTNSALTVFFDIGGAADNGSDYRAVGNSITIPAGQRGTTIDITGIQDFLAETNEFVAIRLRPGPGYNLGTSISAETFVTDADGSAPSVVSFEVDESTVYESTPNLQIGVRLSKAPARDQTPVLVEYRVFAGSATLSNDYVFADTNTIGTTGHLAFNYLAPDPSTFIWLTTNIDLTILQDEIRERNESVYIALYYPQIVVMNLTTNTNPPPVEPGKELSITTNFTFMPTNFVLSTHRIHKVTIIDDDSSVVSVEAVAPLAYEEGAVPGAFRIRRQSTNGYDQPLTVKFDLSGTANAGTDFVPIQTREVTLSAGSDSLIIPVRPLDDMAFEGPETLTISLTGARGAQLDPNLSSATITIVDNDGTIEFGRREYSVSETAGFVDIPVRRSGDLSLLQTVDYAITAGTAENGFDYSGDNGTLKFLPGESEKSIRISLYDDDLLEPTETVFLDLGNPSGGVLLGGQTRATLFIESDDSGYMFSTNTFAGAEFSSIPVTVLRVGDTHSAGSVRLSTQPGSTNPATVGEDFTALNQVLNFAAGVSTQAVLVVLRDDALLEGDETLTLKLSEPQGGRVDADSSTATGIIRDDECAIEFAVADLRVYEHEKVARVNVRRQGGLMNAVSVEYRMLDGTAINQTNYTASFGTLTFAAEQSVRITNGAGGVLLVPGQTNVVLEIPILDDDVAETLKQFTVTVRNPKTITAGRRAGSAQLGAVTNMTVTIVDNDLPGLPDLHYGGLSRVIFSEDETQPGELTAVNAVAWQPNGRLVVGGEFTTVNGYNLNHLARIDSHGELDLGFTPGLGADGSVLALQATADGRLYVGGTFIEVGGVARRGLALLNADGHIDRTFDPGLGSGQRAAVRALALEEGGTLLVGGDFVSWDGADRSRLVRLDAAGFALDGFAPRFDGPVRALAVQRDGRILVGGSFTQVSVGSSTAARRGVARLKADGTIDLDFNPGAGVAGAVHAVAVQPDGHIVIGGEFNTVGAVARTNFARLNANGSVDEFSAGGAGANGRVLAVAVHSSGKIYVGGEFTQFDQQPRNRYVRLRADGGVDTAFDIGTGADAPVRALVVAPNSSSYIGGEFYHVNDVAIQRVARILGDEQLSLASLEFVQTALTVSEGVGSAILQVRRIGSPTVDFTVSYRSVPQLSTATEGSDYETVAGTLHFAPGVLTNQIVVKIIDDNLAEKTETIAVELTDPPVGVDIGAQSGAVISIEDNESSVALSASAFTGSETAGSALITIVRQGSVNFAASVTLDTLDGSAVAGSDYTAVSRRVEFGVNETVKTVQIPILEDRLQEGTEDFRVRLSAPVNLLLGLATATVTIADNDQDRIVFVGSALTQEANGNGTIDPGETVTLSIALRNAGTADTTNLVATLVSASNVVAISGPQTFGFMAGEGSPVSKPFQFRNTASAGGSLTLTFQLSDGGRDLGQVSTQVSLGAQTRTFSSGSAIVINDDGAASPYPSTINVSGLSGTPLKVTVTLDGLTHGAISDVDIMLVAPNGERSIILSDIGGNRPVSGLVLTLDDEASTALPVDVAPGSGTYRPRNSLVLDLFPAPAPLPNQQATKQDLNFKNIDPNGAWSLYVFDDTAGSQGEIKNGWKLNIVTSGVLLSVNDLAVAVTESADPVVVGQNLTYTLRVSNSGPGNATNAEVRQLLPAGVTFISASGGATTNALGEVRASIPSLAVGASVEYRIVVQTKSVGTLTTTATVSSPQPDAFTANNTATITTTVAETAGATALLVSLQGDQINISWPAEARGTLQAADAFASSTWKAVAGTPVLQGGRMTLTVPASNQAKFYRLHQP